MTTSITPRVTITETGGTTETLILRPSVTHGDTPPMSIGVTSESLTINLLP